MAETTPTSRAAGDRLTRMEDPRLLTGAGSYIADLPFAGLAHAVLVRSPHARAVVRGIDLDGAREMPGVIGVFTAADLAADGIGDLPGGVEMQRPDGSKAPNTPRPVLVARLVRHVGEPVAMVVAESAAEAVEAAELVLVDYEDLSAVVTAADALVHEAPAVWEEAPDNIAFAWRRGDGAAVEAALGTAVHVTRQNFTISRVTASSLEPRGAVGTVEDGRLTLYISHQSPYVLRDILAKSVFRVDPAEVRVVVKDVGGSFGMKSSVHPEEVLVLWAARRLGRPVRWLSDRTEAFLSDDHGRGIEVEAALALDREGRFLGFQVRFDVNIGCYLSGRSLWAVNNIGGIAGVYATPAIAAEIRGVFTNTVISTAYRGAGRPEASYAIERMIDIAAREIGIDPFDLRRRNLIPPEAMPFKTGFIFTYDSGEFEANMRRAAELAELADFPRRRAAALARGRLLGIGICNPIEVAGGPYGRTGKDSAWVGIAPDGSVTVKAGVLSTGQGLETALANLVAERLGIPLERVRYRQGDTDLLPSGRGQGGSSALSIGGSAVALAVDKVLDKAKRIAADELEVAAADVEFAGGAFTVVGTDRSIGLAEIARLAAERPSDTEARDPGLSEGAEFQPPDVTFPNGCHICEIEVDRGTGEVSVLRYTAVEDVGRVLNPVLVHGQIHGGIAQGLGQAVGELIVYDRETGQLITASYQDYQMPRAGDMPEIRIDTREVVTAVNPLGVKGVGEAGTVGALAATMNAVCDALAPLGVRHLDMPATPHRVWEAMQRAVEVPG